jgi:hypothetical protein
MHDDQFQAILKQIADLRLDVSALSERISTIHNHLGICQSRCHVPGPPPSLRNLGRQILSRIVSKMQ